MNASWRGSCARRSERPKSLPDKRNVYPPLRYVRASGTTTFLSDFETYLTPLHGLGKCRFIFLPVISRQNKQVFVTIGIYTTLRCCGIHSRHSFHERSEVWYRSCRFPRVSCTNAATHFFDILQRVLSFRVISNSFRALNALTTA